MSTHDEANTPIEGFVLHVMPQWLAKRLEAICNSIDNAFNTANYEAHAIHYDDLAAICGEWCDD